MKPENITERQRQEQALPESEERFRALFERSADATSLYDPHLGRFLDSNEAAVRQLRAPNRHVLRNASPAELSPARQLDGRLSSEKAEEMTRLALAQGSHRFEWLARCFDGTELPLDVVLTALPFQDRTLLLTVAREITQQKRAEAEIRQLNSTLEQRVIARTAELAASEARARTLVEHAPEAIVVLDADTLHFTTCNDPATRLFGLSRERLIQVGPVETSPPTQQDGRQSAEAARDWLQKALSGDAPAFEWMHRHASGRLVPCEIRLVLLPGEGRRLIRASILNNTERRRREMIQEATYQISEATHTADDLEALYQRIHSIIQGLMPARNFYIALQEPSSDRYYYAFHRDEKDSKPAPRLMTTGLNGYVLRSGRALLADRASMTNPANEWRLQSGTPSAIWLGVPLRWQGQTLGIMAVQDYDDPKAYGEEEKKILTYVAEQTALAIARKQAEQALRESEQKFRALFEATSTGVMLHDDKEYLEVNPAVLDMLGYTRAEELIGRHPSETSPPTQPDGEPTVLAAQRHISECLSAGSARFDWVARRADGLDLPIEVILTRVEMGGRQLIQAVVTDITERKRAEEELNASAARLRESEARFRSAFFNSPIRSSIARVSDCRFIEVNQAFLEGLELPREEVIGRDSTQLGIWADPAERTAFWEDLKRQGVIRHREVVLRNPRGVRHTMLLSADIVELHGEPHVLVNALDITQRKLAEEELLRALTREKELSRLKSNFVSLVSHEFRTPLGIISSSSEILRDYLAELPETERREHLDSIARNTRRMSELMEEVLVLGRLDAGKMAFEPAACDLAACCRRIVDEVSSATQRVSPIKLALATPPVEACADERLLGHILSNVLTNAVKYSEAGAAVNFQVSREGIEAVFTIRDHGIGIPAADQTRLFNSFQRGANVGLRSGTGLGLVIVKRCVDLHGGTVRLESNVGEGTTVIVRLPVFGEIAKKAS